MEMINTVKAGSGLSDQSPERRSPKRDGDETAAAASEATPTAPPDADLRLVIERDAEGAYYVYKLIDRRTGAVVAERRRDQLASLAQTADYRAGTVVSTKA